MNKMKGVAFLLNDIQKGKRVDLSAEPSRIKIFRVPPGTKKQI